jgi:hypothetical protein
VSPIIGSFYRNVCHIFYDRRARFPSKNVDKAPCLRSPIQKINISSTQAKRDSPYEYFVFPARKLWSYLITSSGTKTKHAYLMAGGEESCEKKSYV